MNIGTVSRVLHAAAITHIYINAYSAFKNREQKPIHKIPPSYIPIIKVVSQVQLETGEICDTYTAPRDAYIQLNL